MMLKTGIHLLKKKKYSRKQSLKVSKLIFNSVALKKNNLLNQRLKV